MTEGTVAVTLAYDADGNRVAKTVNGVITRYLVDDLNPTGYSQVVEKSPPAQSPDSTLRPPTHQPDSTNRNAWTPSFYATMAAVQSAF